MSIRGDFAKLAKIRERVAKMPGIAPQIAKRAAASSGSGATFTASGSAVTITVAGDHPRRKRRSYFWRHGFALAKGFFPPQWMARIKRASDAEFRALKEGGG